MQLNIFLIICTLLIVKPTVNSLFISHFGVESLPGAYLLVAVIAGAVTTLYSYFLNRWRLVRIMVGSMTFFVISLIIFGMLLRFNVMEGWLLYIVYIWVALFPLLATSQFWILANVVFDAREAKRLFGFIGAGAIAGGIVGGYLTSAVATLVGSENLLFLPAILIAITIPITRKVWHSYISTHPTEFQQVKRQDKKGIHPARMILNSRHLTYIAVITGVSVIVAKLVDYQFSAVALAHFTDADKLTAFFGFWLSTLNIISLIVQLFLTRKVVGVFGVGTSLFFLPLGVMAGAVLTIFRPELWATLVMKISDGSLKQSINKAAMELLVLPIPQEVKNRTKSFIDVFVDSLATGITGIILFFLVRGLDFSTEAISLMIIVLLLVWMFFAYRVRKEYVRSFKLRVSGGREADPKIPDLHRESVIGGLTRVLEEGNAYQILAILRMIKGERIPQLFEPVSALLHHDDPEVRHLALKVLYFYPRKELADQVRLMTADPEEAVRIQAFEHLILHEKEERFQLMETFLAQPEIRVNGAALVSIATETRNNPDLRNEFQLEKKVWNRLARAEQIEDMIQRKAMLVSALRAIGHGRLKAFYPRLEVHLWDPDAEVAREAILAAGSTQHREFLPALMGFVEDPRFRAVAQLALAAFGAGVLPTLRAQVRKDKTATEFVRNVPQVAERINSQESIDFLFELLAFDDLPVRHNALRALNHLKNNFPHLYFDKRAVMALILEEARLYQNTLSVFYLQIQLNEAARTDPADVVEARQSLVSLLERRLDGNLDRIFRLLGLRYPPQDIYDIYKGLHSTSPDLRMNALEFLENLLETSLKRVLLPIVETAMTDSLNEDALKSFQLKKMTEYECYLALLQTKDLRIRMATLYLISRLGQEELMPLLDKATRSKNARLKTYADRLIAQMQE